MKRKNVKAMATIFTAAVVGIVAVTGFAHLNTFETKEINTTNNEQTSIAVVSTYVFEEGQQRTSAGIAKYFGNIDNTYNAKSTVAATVATAAEAETHPAAVIEAQKQDAQAKKELQRQEKIAEWETRAIASNVNEYVYVREEASKDSDVVGKLPRGGAGDVIAEGEEFTYISSGEVEGYVSNAYLATGEEALEVAEAVCDVVAVADADLISVREKPSMDAEILQVANEGETFTVVEEDLEWVKVATDEVTGYMSKEVVVVEFDTKEAEVVAAATPKPAATDAPTKAPAKTEAPKKEAAKPTKAPAKTETKTESKEESAQTGASGKHSATFKVTAYCPCAKCCGTADGITATGTTCTEGRTIAVDPKVIPLGTTVYINGKAYVAEDTGVKGNKIDLYMSSHEAALQWGVRYVTVTW